MQVRAAPLAAGSTTLSLRKEYAHYADRQPVATAVTTAMLHPHQPGLFSLLSGDLCGYSCH